MAQMSLGAFVLHHCCERLVSKREGVWSRSGSFNCTLGAKTTLR